MITVYDMTSGTLRKEFEEGRQTERSEQPEQHEALYAPAAAQLQEIEVASPNSRDTLPEHLLGIQVEDFIDNMK